MENTNWPSRIMTNSLLFINSLAKKLALIKRELMSDQQVGIKTVLNPSWSGASLHSHLDVKGPK